MKDGRIVDVGTTDQLVEEIEGKVWSCTVPSRMIPELEMRLRIINQRGEENEQVSIRYLSDKSEVEHSKMASPRLEDLYLWLFPNEENGKQFGDMSRPFWKRFSGKRVTLIDLCAL